MKYPATFTPAIEGGFVVTFRDIPEAITQGDTEEEATSMAEDVLLSSMEVYFDEKRAIPAPSALSPDDHPIGIPASVAAKVLLLNEMLAQNVTASELARRMGTRPQDINRIIDLKHATKIDTLANAIAAMGKSLEILAV